MSTKFTLIDAGTGNLRSVHKALQSVGADVAVTADPQVVQQGGRLVLPGVGAFGDFMRGLQARGLAEPLLSVVRRGDPLLGICVGMQALFEVGEELGEQPGLGLLQGRVVRFPDQEGLKVPHTGWNRLWSRRPEPLLEALPEGAYAYFNHSFYCRVDEPQDVSAETEYGLTFTSMVQRGNLFGVQFHPEKSQQTGLQILRNFILL